MHRTLKGIKLPDVTQADRKIADSSKWHCTAHAVRGDGAGVRMQAESGLELKHQALLCDLPDIAYVVEQVRFAYGWKDDKVHVFDMLATRKNGERVAYTVKPSSKLYANGFIENMPEVAWWVQKKEFASSVRLLTEQDVDPVALHNADLNAAVREHDAEAETKVRQIACYLQGAVSIKDLTDLTGMKDRGYRAVLGLVRKRDLRPIHHEPVRPTTLVEWKGGLS